MKPTLGRKSVGWMSFLCGLAMALAAEPHDKTDPGGGVTPSVPSTANAPNSQTYASPTALVATGDGKLLFVACATAKQVAVFDTVQGKVAGRIPVPEPPLGLALSRDSSRLYVACAAPESTICVVNTGRGRIEGRIAVGHTAMSPVLSPDEKTLYVCNRFNNDISIIDLARRRELKRVLVEREPVAAAITPDGTCLVVANHLHAGSANELHIAAAVSLVDTRTLTIRKNVRLTLGASLLNGVAISPDGRFAAVTHVRSMYWLSTTGVELGRMNGSALSVLDLDRLEVLGMVLLDQTTHGGANPWAVTWTPDGGTIAVSHAGAHEVSLIDAPLIADRASFSSSRIGDYEPDEMQSAPIPRQRPVRVRQHVVLPGNGPRALALAGSRLYVANYFSDNLCRIDLTALVPRAELLPLGAVCQPSLVRQGEMLFNDAQLCYQGWQSCASCHDTDARTDALNWDLLNDGAGNPKNTRSLLYAHRVGPAMALGVRTNAAAAVRAGIHHILFSEQPEQVAVAMDAYLNSLRPVASPHLLNHRLSVAAKRGELLFMSARTGCADCHPPPLFTDMMGHDVGTTSAYKGMWDVKGGDKPSARFYSPTLLELWRTAPYLHDGSASTLREVLTTKNCDERHGRTHDLSPQEIDDLITYLLAL